VTIVVVGDLIRTKFRDRSVSMWNTNSPPEVGVIGNFKPTQVGLIIDIARENSRTMFRIFVNGKRGWIYDTFLEMVSTMSMQVKGADPL
jgi:hypothetical protein